MSNLTCLSLIVVICYLCTYHPSSLLFKFNFFRWWWWGGGWWWIRDSHDKTYFVLFFKCITASWKIKHTEFQHWLRWWRSIETIHCCHHVTTVCSFFTAYASAWQLCRKSSCFCPAARKSQAWYTERSSRTKWNTQEAQNRKGAGQFMLQLLMLLLTCMS